jgi:hypothetical protein
LSTERSFQRKLLSGFNEFSLFSQKFEIRSVLVFSTMFSFVLKPVFSFMQIVPVCTMLKSADFKPFIAVVFAEHENCLQNQLVENGSERKKHFIGVEY